MKVLQVTPRYPPQSGGVETHVREISERLVERGHDVTVVTADAGDGGFRRERRNGVRVRRYRSVAPGGAMHVCPQVTAAVRRSDADVVHAHNYHSFPLFFAALGVGDRRFVVTPHYHGGSADSLRDRLLSLYRPLGRRAVRRADAVVAVSDWERERLADDFGVDATVIPNGLDVDRFADADPVVRDRPYLLTVGRLEEYKGVQHAIRALTELPEYDLLVAGSGPYREELARTAREEGVAGRVEFLGYVDGEELPGLYAGAEAYLTLSEFEAYGMTVAEALAAGTPCVVRESGALVDWTSEEGVVGVSETGRETVANGVVEAVARTVLSEPVLSWTDVADTLERVYQDVLG
ncbi:glycosyltransferase family 4 protein [Halopelagius longus]|uniref:Glycosyltransferase family 1 protein n=1 Tax=Halopelagius longus TaxID=1236180 RepID=A0A1H1ANY5_9EURY|nr:glycosyltransferase family 4 protein [Halopelagius longus]RDI70459.1 glycosyltransferase family 1 protein [Halopelagius longus]SDQ41340.1 Glycosyltransferase involved in cell wall bisynthesis [Halopelagius longus]